MNDLLLAIVFGGVQGLTEFLPISSSGHLILLHSITDFSVGDDLVFDVALHLGTLLALVAFFWADIRRLVIAWVRSFRRTKSQPDDNQRLAWLLVIGSIPAAVAGVLGEQAIDANLRSPSVVAGALVVGGIILAWTDAKARVWRGLQELPWMHGLLVGFGQAIALLPGVSRSGATIVVGRLLGLDRAAAARLSFLLAMPIIAGAGIKKIYDLWTGPLPSVAVVPFILGALSAAVVGYLTIRFLLRYVSQRSYAPFAWYRIVAGVAILIWLANS
ncbi:MAG: undecaprenyl-diphosphatase UppP [Candidatus Kerfeldbacteria bacterium]|nr:undecaprenyl-diphosphatase UppP [Candidatus Kerfeldbacteria bacterium]